MKILWFTNGLMPDVSDKLGIPKSFNEAWLIGMSEVLKKMYPTSVLYIAGSQSNVNKLIFGECDNYKYYAYYENNRNLHCEETEETIEKIITEVCPDVIHIMGTEFPHAYSIITVCDKLNCLNCTVISIQGLISEIYKKCDEMFKRLKPKTTIRDLLKTNSIDVFMDGYKYRARYEIKTLKRCKNVIGRTSWDRKCVNRINPNIKYYFNNETLRNSFYNNNWSIKKCERHSILFSQIHSPWKGLHNLLEALKMIKKDYPDVNVYVAGSGKIISDFKRPFYLRESYTNMLKTKIDKYNLSKNIHFLGSLSEEEMIEFYLKGNVYVCSSELENSSNSIGEAMILGVPCICSNVGGNPDMLKNKEEGLVYENTEIEKLVEYIELIFNDDSIAIMYSNKAKEAATIRHDRENNAIELINIYKDITKGKS